MHTRFLEILDEQIAIEKDIAEDYSPPPTLAIEVLEHLKSLFLAEMEKCPTCSEVTHIKCGSWNVHDMDPQAINVSAEMEKEI